MTEEAQDDVGSSDRLLGKGEMTRGWVESFYAAVDEMNVEQAASFFTEDAFFRFGNGEPAVGKENIEKVLEGFNSSVEDLHHDILATWKQDDVEIAELEVTYTRLDGGTVEKLPSMTIFRKEGELARDVRIYMDISPVYA